MSTNVDLRPIAPVGGISASGFRYAVLTTRNMVFLVAVIAMNYTLMRPSPVDLLFVASLLITCFYLTLFRQPEITRRAVFMILIVSVWMVSYLIASMPHVGEPKVIFELISKTFAVSIGITCALVSMSWNRKNYERFMRFYIVSAAICSVLGTIGFLLQTELLTWDGRAKGFIDDPNMYGSFLIPGIVFATYFLSRGQGSKLFYSGALAMILLGIMLSFSRVAVVAAVICLLAYVVFHNRRSPQRLLLIVGGLVIATVLMFLAASVASPEFMIKLLDRMTFAKAYDVGENGRYGRYLQVLPMIATNPIGVGVLQLEKIFPEPIHNIWLSSFANYGWGGGISWIVLVVGSFVVAIRNYRRGVNEITIALLISLTGIVACASLHEGEHWRQMWMCFGLLWGLNPAKFTAEKRSMAAKPVATAKVHRVAR